MKLTGKYLLGKTGLRIPRIIYGTSYLGNLYRELSYGEKLRLMKQWFECTVPPVVIDTAGKYGAGLALETIGRGLADLGVPPEDILISNKLGWYRVPLEAGEPTFEPGAWAGLDHDALQQFGYEGIMQCYRQGNELLGGTYRAELASIHDPDEFLFQAGSARKKRERIDLIVESYRALFDLKEEGKVKAVGIGSKDWRTIMELYRQVAFDWVMLANSFTIYRHPPELVKFLDRLQEDGVGIINSAVFHGGFLTGGDFFDYQAVDPESEEGASLHHWRRRFNYFCERHSVVPANACIHFGLSHPAIAGMALNTSQPEKMRGNVEILESSIPGGFWADMKRDGLIDPDYSYV